MTLLFYIESTDHERAGDDDLCESERERFGVCTVASAGDISAARACDTAGARSLACDPTPRRVCGECVTRPDIM